MRWFAIEIVVLPGDKEGEREDFLLSLWPPSLLMSLASIPPLLMHCEMNETKD